MLISDIFNQIKRNNLILGLKLENCFNIRKIANIEIIIPQNFLLLKEKEEIKNILNYKIKFIEKEGFPLYPFPVISSKYNNFLSVVKKKESFYKIITFRKDKPYEKKDCVFMCSSNKELVEKLYEYSFNMLDLLKEKYRFHQIVLNFYDFEDVKDIYNKWNYFLNLNKKDFTKFNDRIYFDFRKDDK